jgi:hypothetical protein
MAFTRRDVFRVRTGAELGLFTVVSCLPLEIGRGCEESEPEAFSRDVSSPSPASGGVERR